MERLTVQSELLTDLSNEQEEIVSGGINVKDLINTDFSAYNEMLAFKADANSGPYGSNVTQAVVADKTKIDTSALKKFSIDYDPAKSVAVY